MLHIRLLATMPLSIGALACTSPLEAPLNDVNCDVTDRPTVESHVDLYPLEPAVGNSWPQKVVEQLLGGWDWNWWMVSSPSFQPDYAVRIDGPDAIGSEAKEWSVELALANEVISFDEETLASLTVTRHSVPLDPDDARRITAAWTSVVRRTRYPRGDDEWIGGSDGITYQFGAARQFGQVWSPRPGFAQDLIELGERLRVFVTAPPEATDVLLADILAAADRLKAKVDATRW